MATLNKDTSAFVGSNQNSKNGYVGKSQTQWGADESANNTTLDKGGMRGAGLIAATIAELALKKKAVDLAEDYYKTNKKDYDFFISTHQGPIAQTAGEAFNDTLNPGYTYDFNFSAAAGMGSSAILDKQWFEVRRRAHRYAVGAQRRIDYEFSVARIHGIVSGWNLGRRYELNWVDDRNNRRHNRRIAVANIGIGVGNIVRQGLASSVSGLASSYDNLGDTVASIGNGLAANSGYRAGRSDTNQRFNSNNSKLDKRK